MKTMFQCEECKKYYANEDAAKSCENKHKAERKQKEEMIADKERRTQEINEVAKKYDELIDAYYRDYGCTPIYIFDLASKFFR